MATNILSSPGVQINETDLSLIARPVIGTNVHVAGFAPMGPTEEIINISSISEYESVFGTPTNASERYLYHTSKQILLQSEANLTVTRLPYGEGYGDGYVNSYSVLAFPVGSYTEDTTYTLNTAASSVEFVSLSAGPTKMAVRFKLNGSVSEVSAISSVYIPSLSNLKSFSFDGVSAVNIVYNTTADFETAAVYEVQAPHSIILTDDQYTDLMANNITWNSISSKFNLAGFDDLGEAGFIVVNPNKMSVNDLYEGYYVGIADNSNVNPSTNFNSITGVKAAAKITDELVTEQTFVTIPSSRLNFALSQEYTAGGISISQIIENLPRGYDFSSTAYKDSLTIAYFKIRSSIYAQDTVTLDYTVQSGFTGSLNNSRTQNNPRGGAPISFALEKVSEIRSGDLKVVVNPYISGLTNWMNDSGIPTKTVRVADAAKNLYSLGVHSNVTTTSGPDVGNIPRKLERLLSRMDDQNIEIDVFAEAGLGTIWTGANARKAAETGGWEFIDESYFFDENLYVKSEDLTALKNQEGAQDSHLYLKYQDIAQQFFTFAERNRKDHIFILDPLRYIFVNGPDAKTSKRPHYVFSTDIYWPLKNLFGGIVSSYGATYANWIKTNDSFSDREVWLPPSGYLAATVAYSSMVSQPWSAPAGFSRGVLTNVSDIAINPVLKQRDLLQKININPIVYFAGDGYVVYGQKTLFNKPSAFDRLNVRRLFLYLEKSAGKLLKYYLFEPNTYVTRARLVNALTPLFVRAKNTDGLYDFKIVCDESNNTPDVIDNNELRIAFYIQPVRTAEYILADFIATRTGVNFSELTA